LGFATFGVFDAVVRAFSAAGWEVTVLVSVSEGAGLFLVYVAVVDLPLVRDDAGLILD
jgi:hypothetical protein